MNYVNVLHIKNCISKGREEKQTLKMNINRYKGEHKTQKKKKKI